MAALADELLRICACGGEGRVSRPATWRDALADFPDTGAAALFLSKSKKRSGKKYLAARRNVERYRQGTRRPTAAHERTLLNRVLGRRVYARRHAAERLENGGPITIKAVFRVSKDKRRRTIHGELSGDCWMEICELACEGLLDEAVEKFLECYGNENLGGQVPEISDIKKFDA